MVGLQPGLQTRACERSTKEVMRGEEELAALGQIRPIASVWSILAGELGGWASTLGHGGCRQSRGVGFRVS